MTTQPTPFDSDAPLGAKRVIIRRNPGNLAKTQLTQAVWGTDPRFSDGIKFRFVRSEGKTFPSHRCLIPASEFHMTVGRKQYRVTLDGGNFFYLAGVWEPALGNWPLAYKIITVDANPEVAHYQDRHGAIIHRRDVMKWLDRLAPESELLVTPPARTFIVEKLNARPVQTPLGL